MTPPRTYPDDPGYVRGSDTSQAAAESMADVKASMQARAHSLLINRDDGLTCDELEILTGWLHQTASARLRELVMKGRAYDTNERRMTRHGRWATVRKAVSDPGTVMTLALF